MVCIVCQEGYQAQPKKLLGTYVYMQEQYITDLDYWLSS